MRGIDQDHPCLDQTFLSKMFQGQIKNKPDVKVSSLQQQIEETYSYIVSERKVWLAKTIAIANVYGSWEDSYNELPRLLIAIQRQNPGTRVYWKTVPTSKNNRVVLERAFWAFGPSLAAFKYCRPVISIDGTHLYSKYKHSLLIACTVDGDNHIIPLAFALVKRESGVAWGWFLKKLKHCIQGYYNEDQSICLISDRHKGIENVLKDDRVGWKPRLANGGYV